MKKHLVMLLSAGLVLCLAAGCAANAQQPEAPDPADAGTVMDTAETTAPVKKPQVSESEETAPEDAQEPEKAEDPTPEETTPEDPTDQTEPAAEPQPVKEREPAAEPEPVTDSESPKDDETASQQPVENTSTATLGEVLALVGQDVNNLYAIAGTPLDSHYEYSCSGPGDDGILYYQDYIVFTYVEDGLETIVDAEGA